MHARNPFAIPSMLRPYAVRACSFGPADLMQHRQRLNNSPCLPEPRLLVLLSCMPAATSAA